MTAKQKAEELHNWFLNEGLRSYGRYQSSDVEDLEGAKFCALKTVDEILNNDVGHNAYDGVIGNEIWIDRKYWEEVKQELKTIKLK